MKVMMKIGSYLLSIALGFVVALVVSSCTSVGDHYQATSDEFARLVKFPEGSMRATKFIGATGGRAYVMVWDNFPRLMGGGTHIYSVPIEELSADHAASVRAGKNPWAK